MMSTTGSIPQILHEGIPVFSLPNYFEHDAGQQLHIQAGELFEKGFGSFVVDFQTCSIINSQGISSLMDLALKCEDDYRGKLVIVNIDSAKTEVLTLVGVIPLVPVAKSLTEAVSIIKG
jgi:anti-anti-sigma regulatory factor